MNQATTAAHNPVIAVRSQQPSVRLLSREGILCAVIVCVCLLLIWPVAEVGINDDWVYTITTFDLARTDHFIFHGWASPMLGWQALWGALFAKLFGATFTAVRLSTVPVAAAIVLLYHAILRRFGLNAAHATFGTLVLALSPVFLPLSASFMTDVPALFPLLLCIYLCQLALASSTDSKTIAWLTAAALSNIAFGTVRQIAWLGVLVIVPCAVWLLRRRRNVLPLGIVLWLIGVLCIWLMTRWFSHQPFTAPEKLLPGQLHFHLVGKVLVQIADAVMTTLLLLVPILTMGFPSLWPIRQPTLIRAAITLVVVVALLVIFHHNGEAHLLEFPWLGNTFGHKGILQDGLFGSNPDMSTGTQNLLFFAVVLSVFAAMEAVLAYRKRPVVPPSSTPYATSWTDISVLLLPFLACYCALLLPRAAFFVLFDRYLLEVVAVLLVYVLLWHQQHAGPRVPLLSSIILAVVALLTVADTHDLFIAYRAEVRLAQELEADGIPRDEIRGGFAFDATTQTQAWGYLNDPRILNPPSAYHPIPEPPTFKRDGVACFYPIQRYLPALHPRYLITVELTPCVAPTDFPPQTFRAWLPPTHRALIVGRLLPPQDPTQP